MKKIITLLTIAFLLQSCKNNLVNYVFEKKGIYDDKIKLTNLRFKDKEIIFFPMHHIGTKAFYSDVAKKIDSLNNLDYFFYTENVIMDSTHQNDLMKFRKILGFGIPKGGYQKILDSVLLEKKISLKKEIDFQPRYSKWNLNNTNSKNIDASVTELVKNYEIKFGEIILEQCDFESPDTTNSTKCKNSKKNKPNYNSIILNYRNHLIVSNVKNDSRQKLALIYGEGHYAGIKKVLDSLSTKQ